MPSLADELKLLLKKKLSNRGIPIPYSELVASKTPLPSPFLRSRESSSSSSDATTPLEKITIDLSLKYMYLYFDEEITSEGSVKDSKGGITYRHSLVHLTEFTNIPDLALSTIELAKFPFMQTVFDMYGQSTVFYHLKVPLDVPAFFSKGAFKNLTLVESLVPLNLECSTIVLSFGKRILETSETLEPTRKDGSTKTTYPFNLVNGFFTAFFNGFKALESESEARTAIANLGVVQVIRQSKSLSDNCSPLVCISYEFLPSSGQVDVGAEEIFRIRDLGLVVDS